MLSTASILAAPIEKEPMMLYIAATNRVISVVMVVERPEKDKAQPIQRPVYYISEVLSASKQNYPHYQKMCYRVYMADKKLRPYFQAHPIMVVSSAPLADIMGSRDATAGWRNGQLRSPLTASSTSQELQSSHKHWPTSWLIGLKLNMHLQFQESITRECTL